jgi:A-macroglobulin TED domain
VARSLSRGLTTQEDVLTHIPTTAALAVVSGVAVASLAAPSAAAHPAASAKHQQSVTSDPTAAAAGYLSRQLAGKHHDHLTVKFGGKSFADDGETADAILSMDAAGAAQKAAKRATAWLAKDVANYAGTAPNVYPGSAAKLLLVAEAQHAHQRAFGGLDLIKAIHDDEGAGGAAPGQYQNPGDTQFSSSVLNQSLAVLALANTVNPVGEPDAAAISFLAGQQCADDGFQLDIRDGSTPCTNSKEEVDTTSYAVQALIATGARNKAGHAAFWLRKQANSDGGFGEQKGTRSNANSTALAAEALLAAHMPNGKAVKWLTRHSIGCSSKASRRGAVRFQGKYDVATATRATSQAVVALAGDTLTAVDKDGAHNAAPVLFCPAHHRHRKL